GTIEDVHGGQADEPRLAPRSLQDAFRIGKLRAVQEEQVDPARSGGDREDRLRRPRGRGVADDEEVVVVVHELVGGGEAPSKGLAHGTDERLVRPVELGDEAPELRLRTTEGPPRARRSRRHRTVRAAAPAHSAHETISGAAFDKSASRCNARASHQIAPGAPTMPLDRRQMLRKLAAGGLGAAAAPLWSQRLTALA